MIKDVQRTPWDSKQDDLLHRLLEEWDGDLAKIAKYMGRSERSIKERRLVLSRKEPPLTVSKDAVHVSTWRNRPPPSLKLRSLQKENNRRVEEARKRMKVDFEPGAPAVW